MKKMFVCFLFTTTCLLGELGVAELKNTYNCVQGTPNEMLSPVSGALLWNSHWLKSVWLYGPEDSACTKLVRKIFYFNEQTGDFTVTKSKTSPAHLLAVYGLVGELINWYIQGHEQLSKICANRKLVTESKLSKKEALAGETIFKTQVNKKFADLAKSRCEANIVLWQGILQRLEDDDAQHKQRPAQKIGPEEAQKSVDSILKKLNPEILNPIFEANCESNTEKAFFPFFIVDQILAAYWFTTQVDSSQINDYINRILLQENACKEQLPDTCSSEELEQPLAQENLEKIALQLLHRKITAGFPPFVNAANYDYGTEKSIPDCVESTIHNLINVLLFDYKKGIYDFSFLPANVTGNKALRSFYKQYPVEETIKKPTNQEWFNLIAELRSIDPSIQYNRKICEAFGDEENVVKIINVLLGTNFSTFKDLEKLSTKTRKITVERKWETTDTYKMLIGTHPIEILLRHGHGKMRFIREADKSLDQLYEKSYQTKSAFANAIVLLNTSAILSNNYLQNNYFVYAAGLNDANAAYRVMEKMIAVLGKQLTAHDPNLQLLKRLIEIIVEKDHSRWPEVIENISKNFSVDIAKEIVPNKEKMLPDYPHKKLSATTLQFLIDIGVDINAQDKNGRTTLMDAYNSTDVIRAKAKENLQTLLEKGANVDIPDKGGETLLVLAVRNNDIEFANDLIKKGANIHVRFDQGKTLLMVTSDTNFAAYLLSNGIDIDAQADNGQTALMGAGINMEIFLLDKKAQPNLSTKSGQTALSRAVRNAAADSISTLLTHGANPNTKENLSYLENFLTIQNGITPLMIATSQNRNDDVKILLQHDAEVDTTCDDGTTALMVATKKGFKEIVQTLLEAKANTNLQLKQDTYKGSLAGPVLEFKQDTTSLMMAAQKGHKDIVELLLQHNADPTIKNSDGKTAADFATNPEIKEMLGKAVAAKK